MIAFSVEHNANVKKKKKKRNKLVAVLGKWENKYFENQRQCRQSKFMRMFQFFSFF